MSSPWVSSQPECLDAETRSLARCRDKRAPGSERPRHARRPPGANFVSASVREFISSLFMAPPCKLHGDKFVIREVPIRQDIGFGIGPGRVRSAADCRSRYRTSPGKPRGCKDRPHKSSPVGPLQFCRRLWRLLRIADPSLPPGGSIEVGEIDSLEVATSGRRIGRRRTAMGGDDRVDPFGPASVSGRRTRVPARKTMSSAWKWRIPCPARNGPARASRPAPSRTRGSAPSFVPERQGEARAGS